MADQQHCPHCTQQPAPTRDGWPTTARGWVLTAVAFILGAAVVIALGALTWGAPV